MDPTHCPRATALSCPKADLAPSPSHLLGAPSSPEQHQLLFKQLPVVRAPPPTPSASWLRSRDPARARTTSHALCPPSGTPIGSPQ